MATKSYRGDAPAVAKVVTIPRPVAYTHGRITITINNKKISNDSWNATALANAWNNSGYPETTNVFATASEEEESDYGVSFSSLILTSTVPGEDFFVDVYIGEEDSVNITNEVQKLVFTPEPTGGTFTLTFSGQTTGAITYIPNNIGGTAANILAALEGLSNIAPGDVTVTPINPTSFYINFAGAYENVNVPLMTAASIDLICEVDADTSVTTMQIGVLPVDEVQILSLPTQPTGGTFTLTYSGQTTAAIAYNANAAAVQSALEALSNIAVGDVVCSGGALPGTPVIITFAQNLGDQDVSLITGDGTSLTGGSANIDNITVIANGSVSPTGRYRSVRFTNMGSVQSTTKIFFEITDADGNITQTTQLAYNASAADIKASIVGQTIGYRIDGFREVYENYTILTTDVDVSGGLGGGGSLYIEFTGNLRYNPPTMASFGSSSSHLSTPGGIDLRTTSASGFTQVASGGSNNLVYVERQSYDVIDNTMSGNYYLTVYDDGGSPHNTDPIDYTETDPTVIQSRINSALGSTAVQVNASISGATTTFTVYYWNYEYGGVDITTLVSNESAVEIIESVQGSPGTPEIQRITVSPSESTPIIGGTFTLTYDGQETGNIDFDATASEIQTALEALSNIDPGDIVVSGSLSGSIVVTFSVLLGNVNPLSIDISDLEAAADVDMEDYQTGGLEIFFIETTRNQGPECFDDPLNYDPVGVPSDGDDVNFEYGRAACRWGIKQRDTFTVISTTTEQLQLDTKRPLFQDGQKVYLTSTGTPPAGLSAATAYFVVNMDGRGRFQLSTTEGGSPINVTDAGTGVHTLGLRIGTLKKPARYEFDIGLPRQNSNGFIEYRPRYLEIYGSQFILGEGQGNDSNLVRIDTGTVAISSGIQVYGTGSSNEANVPSLALLINNSNVDIKCYGGDVGLAPHLDEAAVVHDIEMYDTQLSSIGQVTCRNITGDEGSTIRGRFLPSGTIKLGV